MDWTEIKITVDTKDIDTAGDIANMVVPYGIYIEDYSDLEREAMEIAHIDLIDEELLAKDRTKGIVHIYIDPQDHPQEAAAFLTERLAAAGIENEIDLTPCKNADWENNWKQYFHPIKIGERLLIRPTWEDEYDADGQSRDDTTLPRGSRKKHKGRRKSARRRLRERHTRYSLSPARRGERNGR